MDGTNCSTHLNPSPDSPADLLTLFSILWNRTHSIMATLLSLCSSLPSPPSHTGFFVPLQLPYLASPYLPRSSHPILSFSPCTVSFPLSLSLSLFIIIYYVCIIYLTNILLISVVYIPSIFPVYCTSSIECHVPSPYKARVVPPCPPAVS